jgi:YesN/AraC family two-component response regulator
MGQKILIVDDDPDSRSLLIDFLSEVLNDNMAFVEASNGVDGFLKTMDLQPDMIITDLSMPTANGFDMIRHLRAEGIDKPIFIFSGHSELVDLVDDSMASPVYRKPIDLHLIREHILKQADYQAD